MENQLNVKAQVGKLVEEGFAVMQIRDADGLAWSMVAVEMISGQIQIIF